MTRTVAFWEKGDRVIPPDQRVVLHRMQQVLSVLADESKSKRYLILVTPQDDLLKGQQVSPMELLRMPSPVGFRAVMASLPKAPDS